MKFTTFFTCLFVMFIHFGNAQTKHILVDQFGYQKNAAKIAVIVDPQVGFNSSQSYTPSSTLEVRNSITDAVVFTGNPVLQNLGQAQLLSGDIGWWFDFSSVTTNGNYYIHDAANNESSYEFEIKEEPYREVLRAATKMFYYQRCGFVKSATEAGVWTDGMSFNNTLQDGQCRSISDPLNASTEKDLTGGWFGSADYNRRVTNAYATVHNLLASYQKNPNLFTDNWNWPESGNGVPDLLDEVKWELDWIMKMMNPDGSVHSKAGNQNYGDNSQSPPSANTDPRFYGPTCSSASIAASSILAHGAEVFADFPSMQSYASLLLTNAETCYNYGASFFLNNNFDVDCDTGAVVGGDSDWDVQTQVRGLISASVYLYAATGDQTYQTFIINNGYLVSPLENNYWTYSDLPVCDALLHYTTLSGANTGMQGSVISSANSAVSNNWGAYFGLTDAQLYRDFIPDWNYYSGSNGRKARYGVLNLTLANMGIGDSASLWNKGASILHTFHGVNPLGLVYLSNMGDFGAENSVNEIYHGWFADGTDYDHAQTSLYGPPPGFLSGGPNANFSVASLTPPYGQPVYKSYLDYNDNWPNNAWEISEPDILYQSSYIRLLSEVIGSEFATLGLKDIALPNLKVFPNPANDILFVQGVKERSGYEIYDLSGKLLLNSNDFDLTTGIDISTLMRGLYLVKIKTKKGWSTSRFEKI